MNKMLSGAALTATLAFVGNFAIAQDDEGPAKRENVNYYEMMLVDFKAGKEEEAWGFIYDHFMQIDAAIGRPVINFDYHSGQWDHVVFFPKGDSLDDFEWSQSPKDVEWWAAFVEQEGGEKKAKNMMEQFEALIAKSERHIVHRHMDAPGQE